ncbi:hypothetical protein [Phenylobacterium sp. SCN 70-31]|uniref:hypothetical protein n=1 Tax=Phenylobacterium sp. SCN 70-31 TaxID=1660129 RepID=UPI00086F8205|nr:hypothetical protein [Phenylobacterium sp. SCN 70-31]ODT84850.1 MAG: hypothetical protein ABS78_22090 [Phenylobacterium sp. SCN 70-31]
MDIADNQSLDLFLDDLEQFAKEHPDADYDDLIMYFRLEHGATEEQAIGLMEVLQEMFAPVD